MNRSARHEQQTKATLQAAQAADACAQTRACAACHGSEGKGAGKTAKFVTKVLLSMGVGG